MPERERPKLRELSLFRDMRDDSFEDLMRVCYAQAFPPQLDLIRQGAPADFLHIVVEGQVELYSEWRGRETTMAVVKPVGTFILAACIRDAPYLMSARTLQRSRLLLIPSADLRAVFKRDSGFAMSTIHELAGCYREVVRHSKNLKLRTSRERLAAYLLGESVRAGGATRFTLPVEKRLLASFLGMTPENLSRAMKSLAGDGVQLDGPRTIVISDRARLADIAGPDPLIDGPETAGASSGVSLPGVVADAEAMAHTK